VQLRALQYCAEARTFIRAHCYQAFGRNYQDRGRLLAHLKSIAKGNSARQSRKEISDV
jgi:hypothetical protein